MMCSIIKAQGRQQLILAMSPINSNNYDDNYEEQEDDNSYYYPSRHIQVIHECLDLAEDHHHGSSDEERKIISEIGHAYQSKI